VVLDVGYLLPSRDLVVAGHDDPRPLLALAERAEELGFDSVWAGDSPVARPRADALALLAAVAARTEQVMLGTAVLLPALRDPVLLAHQVATVDGLSGGRLVLGVGSGFAYPPTEAQFAAVGVPFGARVSRLEEAVGALRALWSSGGEPVSFGGRHVRFDDVVLRPLPAREGGPPLWLAGSGEAAERRVGRLADGWLPYPPRPAGYAEGWARVREAAAEAGRADPTPALYATVGLTRAGGDAAERMRRSVERSYDAPLSVVSGIQALFAGDAEEVAAWLATYVEAGVRHVVLRVADDDPAAALDVLGREVLPAVRAVRALR
jgi:probable F420-dependent oxidoreductase